MARPELAKVSVRLVRSGIAGLAATATDLACLTFLTELADLSPRVASVPALTLGGLVMFFGQKYFAFQSKEGALARELFWFAVVQVGGLVLTGVLFDTTLRLLPELTAHYVLVRLVTTNVVWLGYSFPLWHLVFRARRAVRSNESGD